MNFSVNPLGAQTFNSLNCQSFAKDPNPDPFGRPSQKCNWTRSLGFRKALTLTLTLTLTLNLWHPMP